MHSFRALFSVYIIFTELSFCNCSQLFFGYFKNYCRKNARYFSICSLFFIFRLHSFASSMCFLVSLFFCLSLIFDIFFSFFVSFSSSLKSKCAWDTCTKVIICTRAFNLNRLPMNMNTPKSKIDNEFCITVASSTSYEKPKSLDNFVWISWNDGLFYRESLFKIFFLIAMWWPEFYDTANSRSYTLRRTWSLTQLQSYFILNYSNHIKIVNSR